MSTGQDSASSWRPAILGSLTFAGCEMLGRYLNLLLRLSKSWRKLSSGCTALRFTTCASTSWDGSHWKLTKEMGGTAQQGQYKWMQMDILQVLSVLDRVSMARREGELNTTKRHKTTKEYEGLHTYAMLHVTPMKADLRLTWKWDLQVSCLELRWITP